MPYVYHGSNGRRNWRLAWRSRRRCYSGRIRWSNSTVLTNAASSYIW